ncbi:MAG: ABC transporter permease [Terriglobia bacterium]
MINKLIVSNILYRPIRTALSALAVAIEVAMVMLFVGLAHGLVDESAQRLEGVGADILVQPPSSSFLLALSQAPMPIKFGDLLKQIPHVLAVAPVLFNFNSIGGLNIIYGIDTPTFDRVTGGFAYHDGGPFLNPYDILVDDLYARANHIKVGQTISLLNHEFHVCGIVEHGKGARLFIPMNTAEDLLQVQEKASIFFVKCTEPGYTDDVSDAIHRLLPKYQVLPVKEYMSLMTSNNLPALNAFITVIIAIAVGIGFLVIFLSMYTTITERTREIGILKSLGASKGYIIALILREAGLLSAVGIIVGYGVAAVARKVILAKFPTLSIELTMEWALYAAILALAGSALGALYPALRAAQLDPVDALAYE